MGRCELRCYVDLTLGGIIVALSIATRLFPCQSGWAGVLFVQVLFVHMGFEIRNLKLGVNN